MYMFLFSILAATFFFVGAVSMMRANPLKIGHRIGTILLIAVGVGIVVTGTLVRSEETMRGTPLRSIELGNYVVAAVSDDFIIENQRSYTPLLLMDGNGKHKYYLLPTQEIAGISQGGILEVSEIPSSIKMTIRK